jgi:hypothetical protein
MAKKKRKMKKGKRRLGSVIRIRRTSGLGKLGQLNKPSSVTGSYIPPLLGALAAAGTAIALRMMTPRTEYQMMLMEKANWVGGAAGTVAALLLGAMSGRPAGYAAAAGATGVSLAMGISEMIARNRVAQMMPADAGPPVDPVAGLLGAIVMEPHASRGSGAGALGAIVPEYSNTRGLRGRVGAYGDQVNLANVNQQAFGTPGFNVSGAR